MKQRITHIWVLIACCGAVSMNVQTANTAQAREGDRPALAKRFVGFEHGMGIGGWLTNYKRFNVLPDKWKLNLSPGDYEHFETYITQADIRNIVSFGVDHVRLGFDQIVLRRNPMSIGSGPSVLWTALLDGANNPT